MLIVSNQNFNAVKKRLYLIFFLLAKSLLDFVLEKRMELSFEVFADWIRFVAVEMARNA